MSIRNKNIYKRVMAFFWLLHRKIKTLPKCIILFCFILIIMLYFCQFPWNLEECDYINYRQIIGQFIPSKDYMNLSTKYVVPNIAHFNFYSHHPKELLFHELLSLLSAHRIMKADKIFFHHNMEPHGQYWDEAIREIPNLVLVRREPPKCVFRSKLPNTAYETSNSDADRILIILEFGGVYQDLDVLITNSLEPLRIHQTTLGLEKPGRVCGGFIMAAPRSPFMYIWMNSILEDYRVDKWAYISGNIPTRLISRYSEAGLVHVEPHRLHRPNYNEQDQLIGSKPYDWSKNYAVHLFYRKWAAKHRNYNAETIKRLDSTFGQIARKIYYGTSNFV